MTRHIILDTETTGLSPEQGHRVVEIGAVEMINFSPTGEQLHLYMNPEREMETEAERIHGLSTAFLSDKPLFADIAQQFIDFIGDDILVIHNAPFDVGFLNAELSRCRLAALSMDRVVDTLPLARQKFPGAQASLDALCRRFDIDNTHRDLHGALVDADLLASVFVELKAAVSLDLRFRRSRRCRTIKQMRITPYPCPDFWLRSALSGQRARPAYRMTNKTLITSS